MENGCIKFKELTYINQKELSNAYHTYVFNKAIYMILENLKQNELIIQSQYFEIDMNELYKEFIDLELALKEYLYTRLEKDLQEMYLYLYNKNCQISNDIY